MKLVKQKLLKPAFERERANCRQNKRACSKTHPTAPVFNLSVHIN